MIWFTSDLHFGHGRMLDFRPFDTVEEMNEALVRRWNERVEPGDDVYVLGDVALCNYRDAVRLVSRLNGNKLLIAGNHDSALRRRPRFRELFGWIKDLYTLKVSAGRRGRQHLELCHYPMLTWKNAHHGAWHLHGHSHGSLSTFGVDRQTRLDVGVDCWDYAPMSIDAVRERMSGRGYAPVDHHRSRP